MSWILFVIIVSMFGKVGELKKMYDKYKTLQKALQKLIIRAKEGTFMDNGEEQAQIVVDISGEMKIQDIKINDNSLLNPNDKGTLEKKLMVAVSKAQTKAQEVVQEKTKEILGFDPSDMANMMWGGGMPGLN
jgi:DNA-binding protein YbaB